MLRTLLFSFLFLFNSTLFAQSQRDNDDGYLLGRVLDEDHNPINNVAVILDYGGGFYEAHTNIQGKFKVKYPSLSGFFDVHFRKPGYAPANKQLDVNTPFDIQLKPKPGSYIRVLSSREKKIEGIIATVDNKRGIATPVPSDRFGFLQIDIPPQLSGNTEPDIHILGNQQFYDTTFQVKVSEIRESIIEIRLRSKFMTYTEGMKQLEDIRKRLLQNPDNQDNIYEFMGKYEYMKKTDKTPKEKDDWLKNKPTKIFDFFQQMSPELPGSWASQREKKIRDFRTLWKIVEVKKQINEKFEGLDQIFLIGLSIIDLDIEIRKAIGSNALYADDFPVIKKMLDNELALIDAALDKNKIDKNTHQERLTKVRKKISELEKRAL